MVYFGQKLEIQRGICKLKKRYTPTSCSEPTSPQAKPLKIRSNPLQRPQQYPSKPAKQTLSHLGYRIRDSNLTRASERLLFAPYREKCVVFAGHKCG